MKKEGRNKKVVEHFKISGSLIKTGKEFGISRERVRQIAKREGFTWKGLQKEKAERLSEKLNYVVGFRYRTTHKEQHLLLKWGKQNYSSLQQKNTRELVLECYEAGMNRQQTAEKLRVNYRTVSRQDRKSVV